MRQPRLQLVLGLLLAQSASAQYVGLTVGRATSTVDWQVPAPRQPCDFCVVDISPHDSRRSVLPTVSVELRADRWLGVASEIAFAQKGFATTTPTLKVSYLETPLLLRIGKLVYPRLPLAAFAEVGPALAVKLDNDPSYLVRSFDASGIVGIGGSLRVGNGLLVGGTRIDHGFLDIGDGPGGVPTKNRSSVIYLGLLWQ
jgi:hypothetical protein